MAQGLTAHQVTWEGGGRTPKARGAVTSKQGRDAEQSKVTDGHSSTTTGPDSWGLLERVLRNNNNSDKSNNSFEYATQVLGIYCPIYTQNRKTRL